MPAPHQPRPYSLAVCALVCAVLAVPAAAQDDTQDQQQPQVPPSGVVRPPGIPGGRPVVRPPPFGNKFRQNNLTSDGAADQAGQPPAVNRPPGFLPQATTVPSNRPAIAPSAPLTSPKSSKAALKPVTEVKGQKLIAPVAKGPPATDTVNKQDAGKNAKTVQMNFDKRDLAEVIQFVANWTQRNFILPERVSGKITILSNAPIPVDEVWSVFVAALDANNWAVYPVGRYWKLSEKKQSARAGIPTYLEAGQEPPANEQMVTKLFKLHFVEADQMRNVVNQFTSRDSDFQIFPPDTLIISDLGLNMRRLERLIETLDQPGGSEEIHIVQAQYGNATELAQKLTEIFTAQAQKTPGGQKQLGIAEPMVPGQPPQPAQPATAVVGSTSGLMGPVQVSKVIAEDRTNKLIIIASARSFVRVLDLLHQLDVPAGEGGVHVYYLENAKAEEVAATMQALAQGASSAKRKTTGAPSPPAGAAGAAGQGDLFTGDVKITADKNTNSLVIIASNSDYRNVVKVVEKLDIRRRQVFVEAVIMEINLDSETDLGASMHGGTVFNNLSFRNTTGQSPLVVGSELGGLSSLGGVTSLASLSGFLAGLQGPPITIPGLNLTIPSFAVLLNAMQTSSDVNVISTPTVIMTDNSEGEITVGQNVPFQAGYSPQSSALTSALGSTTSTTGSTAALGLGALGGLGSLYAPIQRQNVELRLKIKPQINESDYVRLEVDEQTEEIASTDKSLGPTTSKRSAKTTVVAKDQETVVIGGLIQERIIKSSSRVPILGEIPVLGWLFRSDTDKKTRTNLLLFLTPYIIRDQGDYRKIFERKLAERAEFVKRFTGADAGYEAAIDYNRKPSPLSRVARTIDLEMGKAENGGIGAPDERLIGPRAPRGSTKDGSGAPELVPVRVLEKPAETLPVKQPEVKPPPPPKPVEPAAPPVTKPVEIAPPDSAGSDEPKPADDLGPDPTTPDAPEATPDPGGTAPDQAPKPPQKPHQQ
jgi:general secretion pathway protein D